VYHPSQEAANKTDISEKVGATYRTDAANVVLFGFKTKFGGGRSTGFCLIYDNQDSMKKYEPIFRLRRSGNAPAKDTTLTRKIKKEVKIKRAKVRGTAKAKIMAGKKK
jgi:small subunit ribosomal protein S24e